ncbi:MAG: hypothetical protein IT585_03325 [candidate division Zixibacteria bacterium]|nr:hypothetical protein [candidate division Zixibacteria bacterium]
MNLMKASVLVLLACVSAGITAQAQNVCPPYGPYLPTLGYWVFGNANGSGYSWCISGDGYNLCDSNVRVPAGASAAAVAAALAASINAQCPNVTADSYGSLLRFQVPYDDAYPGRWPTLCVGVAGEPPLCCLPELADSCKLDVTIVNNNPACKCGDADHNYRWSISDVVFLISYIFGGGPPPQQVCEGDADGNGIVTISDAVWLVGYIFSGAPAPYGCDQPAR